MIFKQTLNLVKKTCPSRICNMILINVNVQFLTDPLRIENLICNDVNIVLKILSNETSQKLSFFNIETMVK